MRSLVLLLTIFITTSVFANPEFMRNLGKEYGDGFRYSDTPSINDNFRGEKMETLPEFPQHFKDYLDELEYFQEQLWYDYVLGSEEYDDLSVNERIRLAADGREALGVEKLVKIDEFHKVTNLEGELMGYVLQTIDYPQSAIFQDAAWTVIYMDSDFNVVYVSEGSA